MPEFDPTTDQHREYRMRAVADTAKREIAGIGVPLGDEIEVWPGFREQFDQDCIFDGLDRAKLAYRHGEVIGRIATHERSTGKLSIVGKVSQTRTGDEVLVLAGDEALDSLSIGFRPLEWREDDTGLVTYTKVLVREFSVVPYPAYENARITEVREAPSTPPAPPTEGAPAMPETVLTREALDTALTEHREEFDRSLEARLATIAPSAPSFDTRSPGEFLQALAGGDETAIREYNELMTRIFDETLHRAYTGGTSADAPIKDGWVGDLTRIFDGSSGVLARVFSTGTLPAKGNNIEYAELLANTVQVDEQAAEGNDLAYGKVTLTTKTAPVKTYGGYVQLTRQSIERSTLPVLNRSLEALAVAAGARKKAVLRAAFAALVTAREAVAVNGGVVLLGATLAAATAGNWEDALVDAAIKYDGEDAEIEALIVSASVFKKLRSLTVAGERVFIVHEKNASGTLNLPGLTGNLAGLPVYLDTGQAGDKAAFVNGRALRQYDSAVVSLQDENIINLSKDFSVYRYGAVAPEIPQFVVPVKLAAA